MVTGIACGLAAGALWGLVFVAPRMVVGYTAVDLTAARFVTYGAAALLACAWLQRSLPTLRHALAAAGMSVLGFTGYYLLLVLAVRDAGTEVPSLIIGTIPVWIMLLGKPRGLQWRALLPGVLLTMAGLAVMAWAAHLGDPGENGTNFPRGVLLAIASLVCWTAFALLNAAWLKRHPDVHAAEWANWLGMATGLGGLLMWGVSGSDLQALGSRPELLRFTMVGAATGLGSAWLATILWNVASRRLPPSLCGQLIVGETLFALAYSFVWDGRWPSTAQWAAVLLFTAGILCSVRAHR